MDTSSDDPAPFSCCGGGGSSSCLSFLSPPDSLLPPQPMEALCAASRFRDRPSLVFTLDLPVVQVKSSQVLVPPKSQPRTGHTRVRSVHSFRCSGGTGDGDRYLCVSTTSRLCLLPVGHFFSRTRLGPRTGHSAHISSTAGFMPSGSKLVRPAVHATAVAARGAPRTRYSLRSDLRSVWIYDRSAANVQCII